MTPVVVDASAGVSNWSLTPSGDGHCAVCYPQTLSRECRRSSSSSSAAAVLRHCDLNRVLTEADMTTTVDQFLAWPLRIAQVRPLFSVASRRRANIDFSDAVYVAIAEQWPPHCAPTTMSSPTHPTSPSRRYGCRRLYKACLGSSLCHRLAAPSQHHRLAAPSQHHRLAAPSQHHRLAAPSLSPRRRRASPPSG